LVAFASSFVVTTHPKAGVQTAPAHVVPLRVSLCAADDGDAAVEALASAAARVVEAAEQFGGAHGEAALAWVDEAMEAHLTGTDDTTATELLDKQLALFEECLLDEEGDGSKCKELDDALAALEAMLDGANEFPVDAFAGHFFKSKLERAAARVRAAAAKFGPEQKAIAELWVSDKKANGALNPVALLEEQAALFGECLLDEDGGGSERCKELDDALGALQAGLGVRGGIVPTNRFVVK